MSLTEQDVGTFALAGCPGREVVGHRCVACYFTIQPGLESLATLDVVEHPGWNRGTIRVSDGKIVGNCEIGRYS